MTEDSHTRGSNSAHVRRFNECAVLHLLRERGKASKADLARATHLTNAAIGGIIRALADDGLIDEVGRVRDGSRGQPATLLTLAPDGAYGIGIHLDLEGADIGLIDFSGQLVEQRRCDVGIASARDTAHRLHREIRALLAPHPAATTARLAGIGLTCRSREAQGSDSTAAFFEQVRETLEQESGHPVQLGRDHEAAALAEGFYARAPRNFAHLHVSSSISCTFVLEGQLLRDASGMAADLADLPGFTAGLEAVAEQVARPDARAMAPGTAASSRAPVAPDPVATPGHAAVPTLGDWPEVLAREVAQPLDALLAMFKLDVVIVSGTVPRPELDRFIRVLSSVLGGQSDFVTPRKDVRHSRLGEAAPLIAAATLPLRVRYAPRPELLTDLKFA